MTLLIAVDPGASGAVAILKDRELVDVFDMPEHEGLVSGVLLAHRLEKHHAFSFATASAAWIERVSAMPGQGVSSTFKFGRALGVVEGVLGAMRIPLHYVTPAKWKADAGLSKDKSASRRKACETWPEMAEHFARVKDDGRAEAALIGLYGATRT